MKWHRPLGVSPLEQLEFFRGERATAGSSARLSTERQDKAYLGMTICASRLQAGKGLYAYQETRLKVSGSRDGLAKGWT